MSFPAVQAGFGGAIVGLLIIIIRQNYRTHRENQRILLYLISIDKAVDTISSYCVVGLNIKYWEEFAKREKGKGKQ